MHVPQNAGWNVTKASNHRSSLIITWGGREQLASTVSLDQRKQISVIGISVLVTMPKRSSCAAWHQRALSLSERWRFFSLRYYNICIINHIGREERKRFERENCKAIVRSFACGLPGDPTVDVSDLQDVHVLPDDSPCAKHLCSRQATWSRQCTEPPKSFRRSWRLGI